MEHFEEHYYKLNRFVLLVSGLWPYQSAWSARLMRAVITIVMLSFAIFQISTIFTTEITINFIVDEIPIIVITLGNLTNLYLRIINIDKFRELFDRIWKDWALQKTHVEIKIMHEHAEITRLFTVCYLILMYVPLGLYNLWMFIPKILDIISPMNESRPRRQPAFHTEFFIDEERYFYLIQSHICLALFMIPIIYLASSSLFLLLTQHACGMCELLGYRAERLFCVVECEKECDLSQGSKISCRNMAVLIRLHYNVIQFVGIIETCHTLPFLLDLTGIIIAIVLTLIQVLTISGSIEQAMRSVGVTTAILCYVFVQNYMGQRITDLSSTISEKMYNSTWYNAAVSEQKALLIIMMQRYHPLILTAFRFYVISLQNFGMILQTAISYCMFVRQI